MQFSQKKLLPYVMQDTRWGELIEAVQSILTDVRTDKIDVIKTQFDIEHMSDSDMIYFAQKFGKIIPNYTGYTDTSFYFKRQVLTLIPRILHRNTEKGYKYVSYIYALLGNIYHLYWSDSEKYYGWSSVSTLNYFIPNILHIDTEWKTSDEQFVAGSQYLDNALYLDTAPFITLDKSPVANAYTRHMVYSYSPLYVENNVEFMSDDTCRALYLDIYAQKRRTEVMYFEPSLTIPINYSGTITSTWYNSYDSTYSGCISSKYYSANSGIPTYLLLGDGSYTTTEMNAGVVSVQSLITSYNIGSGVLDIVTNVSSGNVSFQYRKVPVVKCKLQTYSEVAILNASSGVMMYATFPNVNYYKDMYSNFNFVFNMTNIGLI